jgi:geranylgeranyl diphosphate synthase type II
MLTKEEIYDSVERYLASLSLPDVPEGLYAPIRYALDGGGKRLRPAIVLMACGAFVDDAGRALPCAAAVELFHTFTLLHDDIMDNGHIRRGRPTIYKKWGAETAILSGDAMMICAYRLLERAPHLAEVLPEFNRLAIEVCEGQQFDVDFERRDVVTLDEYMKMIGLKTASLIAGAARIGAIVAGASGADADALYRYGVELGLAFQLQDDWLDTYGTAEVLGKTIGGDIAEGKKTFLAITAMQAAGGDDVGRMLHDDTLPPAIKYERVRALYDSLGVPAATLAAVESHLSAAAEALDGVRGDTSLLRGLIDTMRNRNK